MRSRYSRWDDSQDPFGPDTGLESLLDEMSEDVLAGFGPRWSLRRLQREGIPGAFPGLDDMRRRLAERRRAAAEQLNLQGPLDQASAELDHIVDLEREALSGEGGEDARFKETTLDLLPSSAAGRLRELQSYDFSSPEAASRFGQLLDKLKRDVLDAYFKNLTGSMRSLTPEDLARVKDMLAELNDMIEARAEGRSYDFEGFMQRYGDFFPENPGSLEELLKSLARRAAAMSRFMAALEPEQRRALAELASEVMQDMDLAWQMERLGESLRASSPGLDWNDPTDGLGDEPMPLSHAIDAVERVGEYDDLAGALEGDYPGASLADIDESSLKEALGEDAVRDLRRLKEIEHLLQRSGVTRRDGGELKLTAKGARLIGERALSGVLERIKRQPTSRAPGGLAEPTGQTRQWRFGDEEEISVQRTVYNAVTRSGGARPLKLSAQDFEVVESETRPRTATALLLDLSFSMPLRGHWVPAKRMALALDALITGKYPQDSLYLVGFSDYARRLQPAELAMQGWERVHGTNMQHAFLIAHRLLAKDPRPVKQVIMVTDGEPTAHLEDGYACFNWPPVSATIITTLREAARLARSGIAINVFMLEDSPGLTAFMERLARLTGGRVFASTAGDVGSFVIRDYVAGRTRKRSA